MLLTLAGVQPRWRASWIWEMPAGSRKSSLRIWPGVVGGLLVGIGESTAMRAIFETIRKVATSDAPVLILGDRKNGWFRSSG